eukprot:1162161-Lingulodinium_polyedra.AAC.1
MAYSGLCAWSSARSTSEVCELVARVKRARALCMQTRPKSFVQAPVAGRKKKTVHCCDRGFTCVGQRRNVDAPRQVAIAANGDTA